MRCVALVLGLSTTIGVDAFAWGQETTCVSVDASGAPGDDWSQESAISADGRFVAFSSSATNLVAGDTNATGDVFVRDRSTGQTELVSVDSSGVRSDGWSMEPAISADGRTVAFSSVATSLVADDTNAETDVFVRDRATGITERVSVDSAGAEANDSSDWPSLSADGRMVAFSSGATNLVPNDTNANWDVFVRDRETGITERVSVDSTGAEVHGLSFWPSISADGRFVTFSSYASDLVANDTNGLCDVFVHDRATGTTERVSVDSAGAQAQKGDSFYSRISDDGRYAVFQSRATNLVANDANDVDDVFVRDRATGTTERVSVDSAGGEADYGGQGPVISGNGRFVAFSSDATNLDAGDTNGWEDCFVHDRVTGLTECVSVATPSSPLDDESEVMSISANGELVTFLTFADDVVPGDTNGFPDVFVRDRVKAQWSNYGAGLPGSNGVPGLVAEGDPILGAPLTIDVGNSSGAATAALLFVGFQQASLHSSLGGDLLVLPVLTGLLALPAAGASLTATLPADPALGDLEIDLQVLEADAGAVKGVSFTPGLELILGH
jgi:Tol biopolymer transport system component